MKQKVDPLKSNSSGAGTARVMFWKENGFLDTDPMFSSWGQGFFDFGRTLQVLNSRGMSSDVEGRYEDEHFVLSDPNDRILY